MRNEEDSKVGRRRTKRDMKREEREWKRVQQGCQLKQVWKISINVKYRTNECGDGFLAGSTGTGGCTIP